ncbi:MAG: hypothetical protein ABFS14_09930 [Gemmatimonadota bacterium]
MKILAIIFALSLLAATPLAAQEGSRNNRAGLWGGFGFGMGSISCSDCSERSSDISGTAYIGGTVSPSVQLGASTHVYTEEQGGARLDGGALVFSARLHPSEGDFFILLGAGLANFDAEISVGSFSVSDSEQGGAGVIGIGYDIPISSSGKLALTPFGNWIVTSVGDTIEFFQFGLGLTWN